MTGPSALRRTGRFSVSTSRINRRNQRPARRHAFRPAIFHQCGRKRRPLWLRPRTDRITYRTAYAATHDQRQHRRLKRPHLSSFRWLLCPLPARHFGLSGGLAALPLPMWRGRAGRGLERAPVARERPISFAHSRTKIEAKRLAGIFQRFTVRPEKLALARLALPDFLALGFAP